MSDFATAEGAAILAATSFDSKHPPEHIINGNDRDFWCTTGMYPQEFVLQLPAAVQVSKIKTLTTNVRALEVYRCEGATPVSWEKVFDVEMSDTAGAAQVESNQVNRAAASFLKFVILSGWDDFVTVHRVSVEGKSMR